MHNGNNPAEIGRGNEAVRIDEAVRLKRRLIARKTAIILDVNNCKKKLELFEANFEDDSSPTDNQIEDATDILQSYSRAKTRFQALESGMEELRILICENYEATEEEIERDVDKIETDLTIYEKRLS